MEAIEVDAFRRRHESDTFWCGLLLGGCGGQLTTKLYTDRVCHFAHHPGPDGQPHVCGRRARGVDSADHLYVKSAAAAWLRDRDGQAGADLARPAGAPIGSVVDVRFRHRGLRVHLDQAVPPVWDQEDVEPVLGMSVPVDQDTVIRRWYVHRIRLDSEGTTRQVRIGTEAFARPTEWFPLEACEITDRGLSTPAVERIVRSRSTRPTTAPWSRQRTGKGPDPQARAQALLAKLAHARKVDSVIVVTRLCGDIASVTGVDQDTQAQLTAAVSDAQRWLKAQADVRRELFSRLEEAIAAREIPLVRELLARVNATADHDRTDEEDTVTAAAAEQLRDERRAQNQAREQANRDRHAAGAGIRVRSLLRSLQRHGADQRPALLREMVRELLLVAEKAGNRIDMHQREEIDAWATRAGLGEPPAQTTPSVRRTTSSLSHASKTEPRAKRKPSLYEQVELRSWFTKPCPRCGAPEGKSCYNDDQVGNGPRRQLPHDERLRLITDEKKSRTGQGKQRPRPRARQNPSASEPSWRVIDVTCPVCDATPGSRCATPGRRPHEARVTRFRLRFESR
ncbi:hypothetical protein [Streptomyces luteireticuli]|uniref:zinc finger domain-containing protein n=1 Tax=Streptomyces luteireticuli TaxID=173858 RepID=UPI00355776A4